MLKTHDANQFFPKAAAPHLSVVDYSHGALHEKKFMGNVEIVLDDIFKEESGKNQLIFFDQYKKIYNLSTIEFKADISEHLFNYTLKKDYFVLLLLYDNDGKVYLTPTITDTLYFGLPGGGIKRGETIQNAINREVTQICPSLIIGDVEPLSYIKNIYSCNEKSHVHNGLAFACRVRNKSQINLYELDGSFVDRNAPEIDSIKRLSCKDVIEVFGRRFSEIRKRSGEDFQDKEVSTNEKYKNRYILHNDIVKRFILTPKIKKVSQRQKLMQSLIGENIQSVIDVSCGDDPFVFDLCNKLNIPIVVGNDISWSQIELLNRKRKMAFFTNHNVTALPFLDNAFDVAYCSNTLHHMPNREALKNLLKSIFRIAKKVIISEIEDPRETGKIPYNLNKYWFRGFLKDVGGAYLKENDFKIIIHDILGMKSDIEFETFRNVLGKYLIACITKIDTK